MAIGSGVLVGKNKKVHDQAWEQSQYWSNQTVWLSETAIDSGYDVSNRVCGHEEKGGTSSRVSGQAKHNYLQVKVKMSVVILDLPFRRHGVGM